MEEENNTGIKFLLVLVIFIFMTSLFSIVLIYENFKSQLEFESNEFLKQVETRITKLEILLGNYSDNSELLDTELELLQEDISDVNEELNTYAQVSDSQIEVLESSINNKKAQISNLK